MDGWMDRPTTPLDPLMPASNPSHACFQNSDDPPCLHARKKKGNLSFSFMFCFSDTVAVLIMALKIFRAVSIGKGVMA